MPAVDEFYPRTARSTRPGRRSSLTPRPRPARYPRPAPDRRDPRRQTSTQSLLPHTRLASRSSLYSSVNTKDSRTETFVDRSSFRCWGAVRERFGAHAGGWPADGMRPVTRALFWVLQRGRRDNGDVVDRCARDVGVHRDGDRLARRPCPHGTPRPSVTWVRRWSPIRRRQWAGEDTSRRASPARLVNGAGLRRGAVG